MQRLQVHEHTIRSEYALVSKRLAQTAQESSTTVTVAELHELPSPSAMHGKCTYGRPPRGRISDLSLRSRCAHFQHANASHASLAAHLPIASQLRVVRLQGCSFLSQNRELTCESIHSRL